MGNGNFALKAVAVVFFLVGVLSAVDMAFDSAGGNIPLNFCVLGFFVGAGLLRHSRPWRVVALVCACLAIAASLVLGIAMLVSDQPIVYSGWGQAGTLPSAAGLPFAAIALAVGLWQLWVLTRPRIKRLFQPAHAA